MIVDEGKYYLYRHLRNDNGDVFYIGIGKKTKPGVYSRAISSASRNRHWNGVVSKFGFTSEIILESDCRDFIQQKEIEFIKLYGRRDTGSGTLVNLTDGGDNGLNKSRDAIERQLETAKRNGTYIEMVNRMRRYKNDGSSAKRKIYVYDKKGEYWSWAESHIEICKWLKVPHSVISNAIKNKEITKGYILTSENYGDRVPDLSIYKEKKRKNTPIVQKDKNGVIEAYWDSISNAANFFKISKGNLNIHIDTGNLYHGYKWYRCDFN